ncbi:vancomycin resistance protein YoaR [Rhodococcus sp. 27YEA15]|uniref:VanW family protein n=1 Tax=Rhodococcus sp. 27YEA15 TaxID=3156259 RepID=UPI003C7A2AE7
MSDEDGASAENASGESETTPAHAAEPDEHEPAHAAELDEHEPAHAAEPDEHEPAHAAEPDEHEPAHAAELDEHEPAHAVEPDEHEPAHAAEPDEHEPAHAAEPDEHEPAHAAEPDEHEPAHAAEPAAPDEHEPAHAHAAESDESAAPDEHELAHAEEPDELSPSESDESAAEVTSVIPVVEPVPTVELVAPSGAPDGGSTDATEEFARIPLVPGVISEPGGPATDADTVTQWAEPEPVHQEPEPTDEVVPASKRHWAKPALIVGGIVAAAVLVYGVDMVTSSGKTPRGTQVAGVDIGALSPADAEAKLRSDLGPRLAQPLQVRAGGVDVEVVPAAAGVDVDWAATLAGVNAQPINPITRVTSLFGSREVPVVSRADQGALDASMTQVAAAADRAPVEGAVVIENGKANGVSPLAGQSVDVAEAGRTFTQRWSDGGPITVPVTDVPVTVTQAGVDAALTDVAQPAVSSAVVVNGRDAAAATLEPNQIGEVLRFVPDGSGGLTPEYDTDAAVKLLAPQLVSTEKQPKDASFTFAGGKPTVVPGVVGDLINWPDTVKDLPVLLASKASRATPALYGPVPPALTTEAAEGLGINEVIGEYTTGGFEYASGVNIALAASKINGAVVKPGDTFSLNGFTGPRGAAEGYVESGIINNGRPDKAVGGGISQLATTLYNATYFAGMDDVAHTEHSYYISRYPAAREATIFDGAIDLQFRNPAKTGVLIEASATSSDVTVRIWGTKTVEVTSSTGPRTSPTSPNTVVLPKGPGCIASGGAPGFTTSDTRTITDVASGAQISSTTRTVTYDPVPIVKCE